MRGLGARWPLGVLAASGLALGCGSDSRRSGGSGHATDRQARRPPAKLGHRLGAGRAHGRRQAGRSTSADTAGQGEIIGGGRRGGAEHGAGAGEGRLRPASVDSCAHVGDGNRIFFDAEDECRA